MTMLTISAAEFQRDFGRYQDEAQKHPVSIRRDGGSSLVVLAEDEYRRLKRRDRLAFKTEDLDDATIAAILDGGMDPHHDRLNAELDPAGP